MGQKGKGEKNNVLRVEQLRVRSSFRRKRYYSRTIVVIMYRKTLTVIILYRKNNIIIPVRPVRGRGCQVRTCPWRQTRGSELGKSDEEGSCARDFIIGRSSSPFLNSMERFTTAAGRHALDRRRARALAPFPPYSRPVLLACETQSLSLSANRRRPRTHLRHRSYTTRAGAILSSIVASAEICFMINGLIK